jgi:capsule polysaccharide export protein KpsE/RkpR
LEQLEKALSEKEVELAALRARLGEKNDQVRILAEEVQRLRREIEAMRRAA